jgi:hypothetical protein
MTTVGLARLQQAAEAIKRQRELIKGTSNNQQFAGLLRT